MNHRWLVGTLACATLFAAPAAAQDTLPPVLQVTTLEHTPSTMAAWRSAQAKLVEAMKATGMPASEVGWTAFTRDNKTIIVRPRSRDALFGPGSARAQLRRADSAKAAEVDAAFEGTEVQVVSNEISEMVPDLSYEPATAMQPGPGAGVFVMDVTVAPGQGRAFREVLRAMNEIRKELGYPYPVHVYRVRMGKPGMRVVTQFDTRANYFGKNSMGALLEGKTALQDEMRPAFAAFRASVSGWDGWLGGYAADMSYPPS